MASTLDAYIVKNNDVGLEFIISDRNGVRVDITGFAAVYEIKKNVKTAAVVTKKSSDGEIIFTDAENGILLVILDAADTVDLLQGSYLHECVLIDTSGKATTLTDLTMNFGHITLRDQVAVQQ